MCRELPSGSGKLADGSGAMIGSNKGQAVAMSHGPVMSGTEWVMRGRAGPAIMAAQPRAGGGDPAVWESALRFMRSLAARARTGGQRRDWKREDAYVERLSRHGRHPA